MTTLADIETAIEGLPRGEVEQLARWLEELRARQARLAAADEWLKTAIGAAKPGVTTEEIMSMTRGED